MSAKLLQVICRIANIADAISFTTSTQFKRNRNKKHGSFHEEVPVNVNKEVQQHQLVHQEDNTTANMNKMPQQNHAVAIWSNHHHTMIDSDLSFDGDLYAEHFNNPVPESVFNPMPMENAEWQAAFLLKLKLEYFLPIDALLCVSDSMNDYSERRIQEILLMTPS
ncbi:hypothetical protein DAPPUDRAFT_116884 [Daphnia pulex]|uniref:Uncharacterized protein n=1 Tax=Daphnia pulex TaxID=6669 RepID=E9HQV3_DAPPU|nr:hypothetical protein DAPPUDRAFT_116884 [Daphnia pulex]|eukprot:EFX65882.1 hypothetical protein DAPPUDRAFT_116884 [Daphnia pulex]